MTLARHVPDARTGLLPCQVETRELRVAGELRGVEVEPIVDAIGVALQRPGECDLPDVIGALQ
jgi:hypothetical protein